MADTIGSENKEKSLYLIQIQYLEEQLERCQLKYDELEKQNKDLAHQYGTLEKDKKDTTQHLIRSVDANQKKVDKLAEMLESEQQDAEQDRDTMELQHSSLMQDQINTFYLVKRKMVVRADKWHEMEEQLMQKKSEMVSLEEQLVSQREEHEAAINSLMNKNLEGEREIMERQNTVDECIESKTLKILWEERDHHSEQLKQLQFLLYKNVVLLKENDILQDKKMDLCFESNHLKEGLNRITLESFIFKKEEQQLMKELQKVKVEREDFIIAHKSMLAEKEALREQVASVSKESRRKTAEADQLRAEFQMESSRIRQLEGVMQEAVIILRHIMTDSEKPSETEWKMLRLLEILQSTAPQGMGSVLNKSPEKSSRGQKSQTTDHKPARSWNPSQRNRVCFLFLEHTAAVSSQQHSGLDQSPGTSAVRRPPALSAPPADPEAGASPSADCSTKSSQQ
ncbi:cilia- and flagella-associated protein 157-like [Cottoperca gobio]|uniref:Cilia- and flagella-associated protein 157 n=1 Tax=Cottoperca gobio TaxID=56716 RepID=A0A6J2QEC4_COTGO|nr:cilia- and flagella-associated protein 157-like [Cottoperca gobio]